LCSYAIHIIKHIISRSRWLRGLKRGIVATRLPGLYQLICRDCGHSFAWIVATRLPGLWPLVCRDCGHSFAGIVATRLPGLWPLVCQDCGFESRRTDMSVCLSVVNVVFCAGRRLYDGPIPLPEGSYRVCVCVCVYMCITEWNNVQLNLLHLLGVDRRGQGSG
jgi:hypothetical protein